MCACPHRVFRNKQVESPLTAIDFTPDGAGLVVGSTQGRIYMYDLRNLSAPVKITTAHKTSVTCIRFQNSTSKLKVQLSVLFAHKHISTQPPSVSCEVVLFVKLTHFLIIQNVGIKKSCKQFILLFISYIFLVTSDIA